MPEMQMNSLPPGAPATEPAPVQDQGGYCIKIGVSPDGSFSVSKGPYEQAEGAEMANSVEDAFKMALGIYEANPVSGDETAEFESGYKSQSKPQAGPGLKF